ncbi:HNH endonuclease signature motif containing protein [Microbacterium alcoholitolerans]|uniref:HNH endonuclease signature motif containing protein n=1 Tax=unclassified Microbacterium TaxID=2609290 RepID=UPI003D17BDD7
MALFTEIETQVAELRALLGDDVEVGDLAAVMSRLAGDELVDAVTSASALARAVERISIVGAGITATRSTRDAGHDGLAQARGHRTPAALVQDVTGVSHAEAQRHVRLGLSVLEAAMPDAPGQTQTEDRLERDSACGGDAERMPWHAQLSSAMMQGRISSTQQDAIQRGLGQPTDESDETHAAWSAASEQLLADATSRTVEELRTQARAIRDQLDPEGAARRFTERYERRSFRTWTDADGRECGRIDFDDEGAAWMRTIRDAALRPRRGGPRFVDSAEAERAADLTADTRTNDQLSYDLLMDLLRAGALADAESVFGTRQAGVRVVQVVDAVTGSPVAAHTEDYGMPLPIAATEHRICETGTVAVTLDRSGNPLDVGRESRLFTPKQRVALAIRDGGCRWKGCDRPASYCEAHHIDEWHADQGRTDIDRGILLCRHHHVQLHHRGWRISREGKGEFLLHPPEGGPPVPLLRRAALVAAWAGIDPPPRRFRAAAA